MAGTALVTGGSGYAAGFIIRLLITQGWNVRATIRNPAKEAPARAALCVDNEKLRFFVADLGADAGWAEAVAGSSHVVHVASPIGVATPKSDDELIIPARDGTLRVLKAAQRAGVKRVVMTSSGAAIQYGHGRRDHVFTEADWTNVDGPDVSAYNKSKTLAERAARDWIAAEGGGMEFCTINPTAIIGPVLSDDFAPSMEILKRMLSGAMPGCPDFGFGIVDVRDLADIHVRALTAPNMAGERIIATGKFYKLIDIANVLRGGLGDQAAKVPTRVLPNWVVRVVALFAPPIRAFLPELGNIRTIDPSHARDVLGWVARPAEETLIDAARSLIDQGIVKV
jgi:dihydroflavonol-4-reductase